MGLIDSLFKIIGNTFNFFFKIIGKLVGYSGNVVLTMGKIEEKSRKRKYFLKNQCKWWNKNINNKNEII